MSCQQENYGEYDRLPIDIQWYLYPSEINELKWIIGWFDILDTLTSSRSSMCTRGFCANGNICLIRSYLLGFDGHLYSISIYDLYMESYL